MSNATLPRQAEGELVREVAPKLIRPLQSAACRDEDVLQVADVRNQPDVEPSPRFSTLFLHGGVKHLRANVQVREELALHLPPEEAPVVVAGAGVDPVTATAIREPRAIALLQPEREEELNVPAAESSVLIAGRDLQQREDAHLRPAGSLLHKPILRAKPQVLTPEMARDADLLVTMGCGDECPVVPGLRRDDWPLTDPKGLPLERVRQIRDEIRARVAALVAAEGCSSPFPA